MEFDDSRMQVGDLFVFHSPPLVALLSSPNERRVVERVIYLGFDFDAQGKIVTFMFDIDSNSIVTYTDWPTRGYVASKFKDAV